MNKHEQHLRLLCTEYLAKETARSQFTGVPIEYLTDTKQAFTELDIEYDRFRFYRNGKEISRWKPEYQPNFAQDNPDVTFTVY